MESEAVPALLSSTAFPGVGAHDDLVGVVQLLRAFSHCVAIVRLRSAANVGAVSLSWNSAAHRVMADVIASSSWISAFGIRCSVVFGAIGGVVLWLGAQKLFPHPVTQMDLYICLAVPGFMALFFLAIMVFAGISSRWTDDSHREWWGRATGWLLAVALGWLLISGLVVFAPLSLKWTWSFITTGGLAALLTVLGGRSPMVAGSEKERTTTSPLGLILSKASSIAAVVFAAVLLILITEATTSVMKRLIQAYHIKLSYQATLDSF